jgi:hypothetical protein
VLIKLGLSLLGRGLLTPLASDTEPVNTSLEIPKTSIRLHPHDPAASPSLLLAVSLRVAGPLPAPRHRAATQLLTLVLFPRDECLAEQA